ncbi:hypothetical protein JCM1840_001404 [Sporobolomyces johnsonii]
MVGAAEEGLEDKEDGAPADELRGSLENLLNTALATGQLSKELEDLVLFHRIVTQFCISDTLFRALQALLKHLGIELPSRFRLDHLAARLSAVKVQKVD